MKIKLLIFILTFTTMLFSQQEKVVLWSNGAPGALGTDSTDIPLLTVFLPEKSLANGTAVIICPGGGYRNLSMDKEGYKLAKWYNTFGVAAFVLRYRLNNLECTKYHYPAQLNDVKRAIKTVRANAQKWNIDPLKTGVMGFSAGGHLASTISTHYDLGDKNSSDKIEQYSSRPDFAVLVYPVISFADEFAHKSSRRLLFGGDNFDTTFVKLLSNDLHVDSLTPPTFLIHANDDKSVDSKNSILYYLALKKNKVPAELHIYEKGGHGFGMALQDPILGKWTEILKGWLVTRGLVQLK